MSGRGQGGWQGPWGLSGAGQERSSFPMPNRRREWPVYADHLERCAGRTSGRKCGYWVRGERASWRLEEGLSISGTASSSLEQGWARHALPSTHPTASRVSKTASHSDSGKEEGAKDTWAAGGGIPRFAVPQRTPPTTENSRIYTQSRQ